VKDFCSPFTTNELVLYLNEHKIGTRTFFAGNLIRHPAYKDVEYKVFDDNLTNTDLIMRNTFWIGVHPSITSEMIEYIVSVFGDFIREKCK